jgi:hypothetical protein
MMAATMEMVASADGSAAVLPMAEYKYNQDLCVRCITKAF